MKESEKQVSHDADTLLHKLWTKAVGTPGYDKSEWKELSAFVEKRSFVAPVVRVGVAVIVRSVTGAVLMGIRQGSHGAGTWSVPGGHLEIGESVIECADREMIEETGLRVCNMRELGRYVHTTMRSADDTRDIAYVTLYVEAECPRGTATGWSQADAELKEPDKCEGWHWVLPWEVERRPLFPPIRGYLNKYGAGL